MATKRGGSISQQQHSYSVTTTTTTIIHNNSNKFVKMGKKKQALEPMSLSDAQQDLCARLKVNPQMGLTTDDVSERREENGGFNVVKPPIDCPPTVCCLLPCIKHVPSMKAFRAIEPDDAEVLRNKDWIRYDVSSLVTGDIIRLEEGDVVPADCVVLTFSAPHVQELLVDVRAVTGEDKPRSAKRIVRRKQQAAQQNSETGGNNEISYVQPIQLYWGGTVVQGGCIAIVTAIGQDCFVATLIAQKKFPPPANVVNELATGGGYSDDGGDNDDNSNRDESGIALVQAATEPMLRETV